MKLIDSHCHLNFPELASNLDEVMANMVAHDVSHALCVSVSLDKLPEVLSLAERYEHLYASVGVHPDYELPEEPSKLQLTQLANHPKVIAIGETGLDYYRLTGNLDWQRDRFKTHIHVARETQKPLIIHTRSAADDTLRIMREEGASEIGGVMHCFTETLAVAQAAIEMGFYISFSGILTFKNAHQIKEVASAIPLEKILIETDAPYLAPVPHRGKLNQPAYVRYVAEEISRLRGLSLEEVANATSENFLRLFTVTQ